MRGVLVDIEKCLGCHTCELACAAAHSSAGSFLGAVLAGERPPISITVLGDGGLRFSLQCRHCTDAACMRACMSGALYRDESGTVLCDADKCVGCWMCVMTCPFGAVTQGADHKAVKCDLCIHLGEPACVAACPTGALHAAEVEEFSKEKKRDFIVNYLTQEGV